MRLLHLSDPMWENLRLSFSHNCATTGTFVITGSSEQMACAVSDLLADVTQHGCLAHYFLCSGSRAFHIPCYLPILPSAQAPDIPGPYDVLENGGFLKPLQSFYTPNHALNTLKKTIGQRSHTAQLILLEYLTPPTENDQSFLMQLMQSNLSQWLPVLVCIHQEETMSTAFAPDQAEGLADVLYAVYFCGGRIAQHELAIVLKKYAITSEQIEPYLLPRQTTAETWWSYRHSGVAKQLEKEFSALDSASKKALAHCILPLLRLRLDYPLFAIARYADDGGLLLSHYMLDIVRSLLNTDPRELLAYFKNLRSYARREQKPDLFVVATVNYIAMLMRLGKKHIMRLYHILCANNPQDQQTALALHALFFSIGQIFSREKDPQYLSKAADCYQRCQAIIANLQQTAPGIREQMLASIANGSALVALKQGDPAKALQLESSGLLEIRDINRSQLQEILLKTHIGDLLFRSFDKLDEAIAQYEEAHALAEKETTLTLNARLYVAPRLARAYTRAHAFNRAIEVLEALLSVWKRQPDYSTKSSVLTRLEILLPLAQAYLSSRQFYYAAHCYSQLLLEPEGISPAVLKGIARNLRSCLPGQPASFWGWVEEVITTQEQLLVDIERLSRLLAA